MSSAINYVRRDICLFSIRFLWVFSKREELELDSPDFSQLFLGSIPSRLSSMYCATVDTLLEFYTGP